ncbi:MAG: hypothetical protein QE263_04135 [Vampirovibrionales bacterium]|nr:hypothetical protein [Vampirovibrionales bacterium]
MMQRLLGVRFSGAPIDIKDDTLWPYIQQKGRDAVQQALQTGLDDITGEENGSFDSANADIEGDTVTFSFTFKGNEEEVFKALNELTAGSGDTLKKSMINKLIEYSKTWLTAL